MALETWVARFVVDHGRVTEEGSRLRAFQRRRIDEADVDLYLLAEPEGAKGDELGSQALDAIGRLFLQDRLSLTGALLRALNSTSQTLLEWNRRSLPREQVSTGLVAATVSGTLVYLAQVGPGLVYLRHAGRLQRLLPTPEALAPLGQGESEPVLRRLDLEPGDVLIAASPALASLLDAEALEAFLSRGSDEALPELYLLTRDLPNFALFAVSCRESEEAPEPTSAEDAEAVSELMAAVPELAVEPARNQPRRPAGQARRTPLPQTEAEAAAAADESQEPLLSAPPPLDISRPVVRLRRDQTSSRSDYVRTTGPVHSFQLNFAQPKLLGLLGALAVVLFVGAFTVPNLVRQGRGERVDTLVANAQTQFAAVPGTQDPAQQRSLLDETRRLATEALRIDPLNATAAELRQQASDGLASLDAIVDLGPMTTLTTLSRQVTGEVSLSALIVANGSAYVLDSKGGRILAVPLAGGPPTTLYADGTTYSGTPAKKPAFIAWEDNGAGGRLLVLDQERKLFAIAPGLEPQPLPLRRTNTWSSVGGIAAYTNNLYVLDPRGNQVHRYLPAAVGFDSEPGPTVSGPQDLSKAHGLAVDGDILVFETGMLHRYRTGSDLGFPLGGIDRPPKSIIAVAAAQDEVYIADSGNKRIIVATQDGAFKRQLVSNAFTDLRALAVDPTGVQLYVVVGDALLTAPIPH